jgi:protein phosphatase
MAHGDRASHTAVDAFVEAYLRKSPKDTIPAALDRALHAANDQVVEEARKLNLVEEMGTTLVAAVIREDELHYISVGDSGLFHARSGQIRTMNRPHVFANYLDQAAEQGTITHHSAQTHPGRDLLTSFVGAQMLEEIDRSHRTAHLLPGDVILLASDGLFNTLSMEEIGAAVGQGGDGLAERLVAQTLAAENPMQDNVTILTLALTA